MEIQGDIFGELSKVREIGLTLLDNPKHADLELDHLTAAAKSVPGYAQNLTKGAVIKQLLEYEIPRVKSPGHSEWLIILFGLRTELAGLSPVDLRTMAANAAKDTRDNFKRPGGREDQALRSLEAQIVADCFQDRRPEAEYGSSESTGEKHAAQQAQHALDFPEQVPFSPRPTLETRFDQCVNDGQALISLEGEPGNGKSRLARELIRSRLENGGTVAYLRTEQLLVDIAGALASANVGIRDAEGDELKRLFASLVSSEQFPTYVLIDNVDTQAHIEELVPPTCRSIVVVTSRESVLPQDRGVVLPVKAMEDNEAIQLVQDVRPRTSDTDTMLLVASVGARPLAIIHACGFIGDGEVYTIKQFCDDLNRDAAATFRNTVRPVEWTLTWIYEKLITGLQLSDDEIDRDAAQLLKFVAYLGSDAIPHNIVSLPFYYQIAEISGTWPDDPERRRRFVGALRRAQKSYLLEPRPDGLSIHVLTQALLHGIYRQVSGEETLAILHASIVLQLQVQTPLSPVVLQKNLIPWLPHILKIAQEIFDETTPENWEGLEIFGPLNVAVTGLRQSGRSLEVHRLRGYYLPKIAAAIPKMRDNGRQLRSDGFRAFLLGLITCGFDAGEFEYEEYVARIAPVLAEADPGREPIARLGEGIYIIQRFIDGGFPAREQLQEFDRIYPAWRTEGTPELRGNIHRLLGESHLLCGEWRAARQELEAAWSAFGSVDNRAIRLHGQTRTIKDLIDLDCYSGVGFAPENVRRLGDLKAEKEDSRLSHAFLSHAVLRVQTQIAVYGLLGGSGHFLAEEIVDSDVTEVFVTAYLNYVAEGSRRLAISLLLDWEVALISLLDESSTDMGVQAEHAADRLHGIECWPNPLASLTSLGRMMLISEVPARGSAIRILLGSAHSGLRDDRNVQACYEGLMVGHLLAEVNKALEIDEELEGSKADLELIRRGLEELGLGHRWNAFYRVIESINSGDRRAYQYGVALLHAY